MPFQVAVDGPVASGKGTVARLVAERLGFLYIDTGAMYRMAGLWATRHNISLENESQIVAGLANVSLEVRPPTAVEQDGRLVTALLNGEDVSWQIRTEEMSAASSKVGTYAAVRALMVQKQQQIAEQYDVVMEGRDITYRVLPNAQLKIYLTASAEVRAERRHKSLVAQGHDLSYDQVYQDLLKRDEQDTNRTADPLKITDDAWVLDTTNLSIPQVVELIVAKAKEIRA